MVWPTDPTRLGDGHPTDEGDHDGDPVSDILINLKVIVIVIDGASDEGKLEARVGRLDRELLAWSAARP